MKIDLNTVVASQLPTSRGTKQASSDGAVDSANVAVDRTTFSTDSASVHSLAKQALSSPEIRQDKVDALSQAVTSGTYTVDANKIASGIIAENSNQSSSK